MAVTDGHCQTSPSEGDQSGIYLAGQEEKLTDQGQAAAADRQILPGTFGE